MAYNKSERPDSPMKRRGGRRRKKVCVFCGKENNEISYKDANKLKRYEMCIRDRYMIVVGDREETDGTIALRSREEGDLGSMKLEEFLERSL